MRFRDDINTLNSKFEEYEKAKEDYENANGLYGKLPIKSITTDFKSGKAISIQWDENDFKPMVNIAQEFLDSLKEGEER